MLQRQHYLCQGHTGCILKQMNQFRTGPDDTVYVCQFLLELLRDGAVDHCLDIVSVNEVERLRLLGSAQE